MIVTACVLLGWHVNMSSRQAVVVMWINWWVYHLLLQFICLGIAGFHLGLVHHVVCGQTKRDRQRKRERGKKVVDKMRISDNASVHFWPWKSHPSVWHMLCAHIHSQTEAYTQSKSPLCFHIFPCHTTQSQDLWDDSRGISLLKGCHLLHAASTHHYLLSLQYIQLCLTVCRCKRGGGSTLISLYVKYISHHFVSKSYIHPLKTDQITL